MYVVSNWARLGFRPAVKKKERLRNTHRSRTTAPVDLEPPKGFRSGWFWADVQYRNCPKGLALVRMLVYVFKVVLQFGAPLRSASSIHLFTTVL